MRNCLSVAHTGEYLADGFGAQYVAAMTALAWAHYTGRSFCRAPWQSIGHNVSAERCNEAVNFPHVMRTLWPGGNASSSDCSHCAHCQASRNCFEEIRKHVTERQGKLGNVLSHSVLQAFRAAYDFGAARRGATTWRTWLAAQNRTHVAVHIRRGDIANDTTGARKAGFNARLRYVPLTDFAGAMQALRELFQTESMPAPIFHVFSEGRASHFAPLSEQRDMDVALHLVDDMWNRGMDPTSASTTDAMLDAFDAMVHADRLLYSRSSFSQGAALLRTGARQEQERPLARHSVFYLPGDAQGWFKRLPGWFKCEWANKPAAANTKPTPTPGAQTSNPSNVRSMRCVQNIL